MHVLFLALLGVDRNPNAQWADFVPARRLIFAGHRLKGRNPGWPAIMRQEMPSPESGELKNAGAWKAGTLTCCIRYPISPGNISGGCGSRIGVFKWDEMSKVSHAVVNPGKDPCVSKGAFGAGGAGP